MSNPKLHELLAVGSNLENQANKVRTDIVNTFEKKRHLFEEKRTTFTPSEEGARSVSEFQSDIQSSVKKELAWVSTAIIKAFDVGYQIAEANTLARADIVLEDDAGTVLLTSVPATALLELEKRIAEIGAMVASIPTLDPAKGFKVDESRSLYVAREVNKTRTKKTKVVLVKYEATDKHPAQTELIDEDVPVGTIQEQEWSGLITPSEKAELINRVEVVQRAVRRARSRANEVEVNLNQKIGKKIFDYIFAS